MKKLLVCLLAMGMSAATVAQVSSPARPTSTRPPAPAQASFGSPQPGAEVTASLAQLNQVTENVRVDLARLRLDKWKGDSRSKRQAEADAESVQRNITAALPTMVQQVRANPGSVGAIFKLYRNLNALYDVMSSLTESAGAFGSKDEYEALATDTSNLDGIRRSLADRVEAMASARDTEVAQLQMRARQAAATATAAPPKKIVVDDTAPAKKSTKKRAIKKKTTTASEQEATAKPQ
ncbi:MAG: hypothetical protein LAN64_01520 [Acidobacteriia bacterium]|nr:hypothetical protein [Terriglobia bacterium]